MSELLPTIERVVQFLKDVPGFRELPINDQILLIKKGAFDVVLSQAMPMVDSEKLSMLDPQLKYRNTRLVLIPKDRPSSIATLPICKV